MEIIFPHFPKLLSQLLGEQVILSELTGILNAYCRLKCMGVKLGR